MLGSIVDGKMEFVGHRDGWKEEDRGSSLDRLIFLIGACMLLSEETF